MEKRKLMRQVILNILFLALTVIGLSNFILSDPSEFMHRMSDKTCGKIKDAVIYIASGAETVRN